MNQVAASGQRILAVEDSTRDARLLRELLREVDADAGLTVVRSLRDAEAALASQHFDGVLLDLGLPDGDGVENIGRVRAIDPDVAIVVLTGRDDDRSALEALRRGAQEYLVKGAYDGAELLRTLQHAIERHRLVTEISDEREREYFRASHDALTGLPNRQLLLDRARLALNQSARTGGRIALVFLDLDGFKPVNDTHGHAAGDMLLREVARVLRDSLREGDTVARVGGDEFIALLSPLPDKEEADLIVQRMIRNVGAIHYAAGHRVDIGISAGIAIYPDHGSTLEGLLKLADEAMYQAKRQGKGRLHHWAAQSLAAEPYPRKPTQVAYEPWLSAGAGVGGFLASATPAAPAVDLFAVVASQWRDLDLREVPPVRLALRLTATDLQVAQLSQTWLVLLADSGFTPQRLRLLVAPEALAAGGAPLQQQLSTLRAAGVQIAADRISPEGLELRQLAGWPLDAAVLDYRPWQAALRSAEPSAMAVIGGVLAFSATLGRELVLDGLADEEDRRICQNLGRVSLQGPFLKSAATASEVPEILRRYSFSKQAA